MSVLVAATTHWRFSSSCLVSTWAMNFSMSFSSTSWATSCTHSGNGVDLFLSIPKWPIRSPTVKRAAPPRVHSSTSFSMVKFSSRSSHSSHNDFRLYTPHCHIQLPLNLHSAVVWRRELRWWAGAQGQVFSEMVRNGLKV